MCIRDRAKSLATNLGQAQVPASSSDAAPEPEYVQALRRNAPVHMCDPALPSHTRCGWHFACGNAHWLLADPVGPDDIDTAPLCLRCLRRAPAQPAASDS
eukprot:4260130-Alexandrium_andersonii.AAC.1